MGIDYTTPLYDKNAVDDFINVSDADATMMLKKMAREYGLLIGPASGAAAFAVHEYAKNLTENDTIIFLCTDSGRAYLTKPFYN
jgi:cysteine synthase A